MDQAQRPDEWLMAEVRLGERAALEPLIRRYATPLLTFIQRMIGDRHHSEELFQEVFLAVWKKRRQYQFPRPFKPWLYRIAINRCRAAFRGRGVPTCDFPKEDSLTAPGDSDPSPPDQAIATETAALVTAAVTRLPPQQRLVVVLRIWDELSYAEIASLLGRTEATVRSHMHHGLAALKQYLGPRLT
jgi:RNA polymerase sigma-70 factor (ECF subfamily)